MIDFKKAIHLVSGISAKGSLKHYFETNYPDDKIEIHCIYDDLSVGPLNDFTSPSDYETYSSYWKAIENISNPNNESNESYTQYSDFFNEFKIDFPPEKPLIIWHGSDTNEKIMLYRYCALLNTIDLYEINLDDWPVNPKDVYNSNSLATRNPEHMDGIFNHIKKIEDDRKFFYAQEWERLKNDQKLSRIFMNGQVISVEEDYYDQALFANCSSEYQVASRVIGTTMEKQESTVGDHYLWYRIHVLLNQNLLESRGNPTTMRNLEIRKK